MAQAAPALIQAQAASSEFIAAKRTGWNLPGRIGFRFVFAYLVLYNLQSFGEFIPGLGFTATAYNAFWHKIAPWVAIHVFHLSGPVTVYPAVNGSGDTTLDYIAALCYAVTALAATLIWSLLDRKRADYRRLHFWLRLSVRYTLAFTLFGYGFAKVFPSQFIFPGFGKLVEPFGEFSPMGVLWYFMGYSKAYIIFSGMAEVTAATLLLFRRTPTLGALASFAVLLNVVMLNFCYDVPVKLYSSHLLLMAVFLAAPDLRRLADVLVFNRASRPVNLGRPPERRWMRIALAGMKVIIIGYVLFFIIQRGWETYQNYVANPARPPLYGLYEVETFTRNGKDVPPLTTDASRWRRAIIQFPQGITLRMMDDSVRTYASKYDDQQHIVTLSPPGTNSNKDTLAYWRPDGDHVLLEGKLGGDALSVKLRKMDTSKFLLVNRGFHWINERPFNR